ncbi:MULTISPECIES: hypothetical protein [unclassified Mesorhizobium]|uniref:hypothetical protein n=1 Tax=unclassified Mesorhizobium TaxID=325217 RepID=UPI000FD8CB16|nr:MULTISPECIES: hypothetical protein [unclassified Mesorhizobium]TGT76195.1 hypothetical protein EN809_000795 [Mesorhizobium sp. M2E.F.Ca.ET.166.01.1.1]TGW02310.1 hypothetical protein EN797_000795 [Mesorhizobium sp. M2E.F.Ca.ET.154.01.1.1]
MSIEIRINADPYPGGPSIADQVNEAMAALGFVRAEGLISSTEPVNTRTFVGVDLGSGDSTARVVVEPQEDGTIKVTDVKVDPAPARVPGQPSPGKARRTKAEIAEDEAAAKANHDRVAAIKEDVLAGAAEQQAAYDSPEDAAQDAADEAAESAANKTGLTLDDLRHAAARYQKKFGMAAAVAGIPALLGCAMVDVPESELAAAIAKIDEAVKGDAPGAIEEKVAEVKPATKDDVQAAMLRYALKFDGQNTDFNAMPKTMEDAPKIFSLLFGEGVVKLSQVPADGYAKTVAAFDEAIEKNPFKRGAK